MLKVIGCMMILLASTGIGFIYGERFKKRTNQLNELRRCIHQLQNEIVYTHTPLPEAIMDISKKSNYPIKDIFEDISNLLFDGEVDDVYEAFRNVFIKKREDLNLKREDINVILDLSKTLGESDIEGQQKMFALTLENIKKQLKISEELMSKNLKMYRYLGFSFGAMLVIILI
ncbi:stage III sporulation protein SpoIIIAB [Clostridium sp. CX1]|uniref:Stage III sporulation protein SpoIIIAB n=1 Tax=Clostridium tanneri TaxID=3037988 RepID=A0ABU4JNJ3_9CLOT|nr:MULTISPECIES: stage III sporulation protein SpoIIIAB [unclassified Clostridium]MCT8976037.1 stage III sporulation protein SpoIIIAB [Clostridium sp. CX1]MDW8799589.1 stage III sporulation protein SpoIIIAB [Clostridium sp. A1-XYC3]